MIQNGQPEAEADSEVTEGWRSSKNPRRGRCRAHAAEALVRELRPRRTGADHSLRDATREAGAGRFCSNRPSVGHSLLLARHPRLLAPAVAALLPVSGHAHADAGPLGSITFDSDA
jgi:hypothetical protein